ncbi:MAG: (d)CMP kinase [Oscillospiraceae bacterium]|nr:(d)CMP kinase [Oscillospiraceae bacterium]MBR2366480.1 (d)CMP kinase [Oscillospiraceae bacterium]MBR2896294.1 (d)CMP kinase [Oscillospiraceae bacterium]MBR2976838.1 (d)CMP kinase [Oscillospiraceae bacterium]MBR3848983.1 (d)CMP kinase [Oscillospiraceae bacterium]
MKKFHAVAIDGPAGSGKSTIAKRLAKELGYVYVDTGAIYRTVGYYIWICGIGGRDGDGVRRLLDDVNVRIEYPGDGLQHMFLNGRDITEDIRTPEISSYASQVSAHKCVRDFLLDTQRDLAASHNVIMDGRDIGTVVLPDAEVKIFLTASPEVRARRRHSELQEKGCKDSYEKVLADMKQRDHQDSTRAIAPLRQAEDAVLLDTSEMDLEEAIAAAKSIILGKLETV